MVAPITEQSRADVWFAYDGDCPICTRAAQYLRIKESLGNLQLVNARDDREHPFIQEINNRVLNLDDGMVLKFREACYHGEDALHMMALLGSNRGWSID
jgi:predicted DCC family thiol-disulfide oxidoreductase YuxK